MKSDKKSAFVSLQFVRICMTDEGTRHKKRVAVDARTTTEHSGGNFKKY